MGVIVACSVLVLGLGGTASASLPDNQPTEVEPDSQHCGFFPGQVDDQVGSLGVVQPGHSREYYWPGPGSVTMHVDPFNGAVDFQLFDRDTCEETYDWGCSYIPTTQCSKRVSSQDIVVVTYDYSLASNIHFRVYIG